MFSAQVVRGYRLFFAAVTLVAIAWQYTDGVRNSDTFRPGNFFSFFTIQSNLLAGAVFILLATVWQQNRTETTTLIRGAAVAYMSTTFVVYGLLLAGYDEELQLVIPWVNNVVHRIVPLVLLIDWMIDRPQNRLTFRRCLVWMAYPLAYLAYSLIRGPIVDWYPYPFLDPDEAGGYPGVAAYCIAIAVGFLGFVWLIVTLGNRPWERNLATADLTP
jgi:hypothetical protein